MAAIRGRRPLLGVLSGGSGGTYIAPLLRNARGRGVLLGVLGGGAAGSVLASGAHAIAQQIPPPTQAIELGWTPLEASLTQTFPVPTQAGTFTFAPSNARAVRVTYLVLEVPDPAITAVIAASAPVFQQALAATFDGTYREAQLSQTVPAVTQSAELTVQAILGVTLAQAFPSFQQAVASTFVPSATPLVDRWRKLFGTPPPKRQEVSTDLSGEDLDGD